MAMADEMASLILECASNGFINGRIFECDAGNVFSLYCSQNYYVNGFNF